ncbi:hypothetical protein KDD17_08690 [Sulfitobacter albidus]|uniref:Uncharacterized protein n=1 Tax=Sulfitobacter albidus TaxID=2829501 RepID=A0A975PL83_9RHOB|nr:hypothetical protein [Sulfitobacter albidus]QUJ75111.1 hypothetical protein KDD17_08690 [Sulfitobacter albidus]
MYTSLAIVLFVWMFGCAYAGYARRFGLFAVVAFGGMALNTAWMVVGLGAHPFEGAAMFAHAAAVCYAFSALALGFLIGRLMRALHESRVE